MKTHKNRSNHLPQLFALTLIGSLSFGLILPFAASAQSRSFGVIGIDSNQNVNLPSDRYDDYDIGRYQDSYDQAERRLRNEERRFESINRDYERAVDRKERADKSFQAEARKVEMNQKLIPELEKSIEADKQVLAGLEIPLVRAANEVRAYQTRYDEAKANIEHFKARRDKASPSDKVALDKLIAAHEAALVHKLELLNTKKQEQIQLEAVNSQKKNAVEQNTKKLETAKRDLEMAQSQVASLKRQAEEAQNEVKEMKREVDFAADNLRTERRNVEIALRNLDRVERNISVARQILEDQGHRDGENDGRRECFELTREASSESTNLRPQGRFSNNGDDRYYNPRRISVPHDRLTRFYPDAYDRGYRDELDRNCRIGF